MSIAVAIFVGGEERYCLEHGVFMIHPTTLEPFQEAVPWEKLDAGLKSALADDLRTESILRERATPMLSSMIEESGMFTSLPTKSLNGKWCIVCASSPPPPKGNQIIQI